MKLQLDILPLSRWFSDYSKPLCCILPENYTQDDYNKFLKSLNFNYDNSFGTIEIYGCILYKNNSWSYRDTYNKVECWNHIACPTIKDFI